MNNNRNTIIAVIVVIAVIALGIGYALYASDLTINGTATANTSNEFTVTFDGVNSGTGVAAAADRAITGTCSATLTAVNDSQTCTYEIKNYSPAGLDAIVRSANLKVYTSDQYDTEWTSASSAYFDIAVTPGWAGDSTTLAAGTGTTTFTVTVTLKKANASDESYTQNFYVRLENIEATQA